MYPTMYLLQKMNGFDVGDAVGVWDWDFLLTILCLLTYETHQKRTTHHNMNTCSSIAQLIHLSTTKKIIMAGSCAKCGKGSEDLRRCTRCINVAYCNRDCQVAHWKEHKKVCVDAGAAACNESTTPYPDRPANTIRTKTKEEYEHSKQLRKALREGTKIVTVAKTAQGYILPGEPLPDGVPANFHLKQESHVCFFTGPATQSNFALTSKRGNFKYEKTYREYYDDLVSNEAE